ncbi:hypothetical protein [Microbacterium atlanticum]|uniref:hypothetical protein n=1 Tax=Microbacterium atlanticum TaxID=2782168 RepID=UPI001888571D|nr:hypothetical protein [Microbacterium atlanticum]
MPDLPAVTALQHVFVTMRDGRIVVVASGWTHDHDASASKPRGSALVTRVRTICRAEGMRRRGSSGSLSGALQGRTAGY